MISSTHIDFKASRKFRRLALNTVISLYLVIIAGGVVRSTGSGMGCPDWPKCFGQWVPPTELSQLPENYKEIYGAKLKGEVEFNPVKTWTEYVNRLVGVVTGIMIFLTLLASVPYLKTGQSKIFFYSLAAFILVGVQGWLGAKVVATELMPGMITIHMLLAIVIVFILLYLFTWSTFSPGLFKSDKNAPLLNKLGLSVLGLSFMQILLGTQVREHMDEVIHALGYGARAEWIEHLGTTFYVHRSFSILVVLANFYWLYQVGKSGADSRLIKFVKGCQVVLLLELFSGIAMAYFGVPPFAQPMHLTMGILLIGIQYVIWLLINEKKYLVNKSLV
ncbi:MAG TPA: COX15/CtaA family protein [Dyadobacter sp.]|nr:COX15/CtaA family protein [Dyadobacter sp.]